MNENDSKQNTFSGLPAKPASFDCHYAGVFYRSLQQDYDGVNWWPKNDCPDRLPKSAKFVGAVEWSWTPWHSRSDKYYLSTNRSRTYWILWLKWYDDNETLKWVSNPIAYGPKKGVSEKVAAIYLLLEGWRGEMIEYETPGEMFHAVTSDGLLSSEELYSIAALVWPDSNNQEDSTPE